MADRIPLRIVTVSGVPTIGEFQRGDTVGVVHGGTGVSSIAGLKAALDYNLSGLDDVAVGFPDALAANQILVWNGTAWINEYNDKTEMRVRNGTASAMSKGDVIAIEDAHNANLVNVILADASQTSAMPALGVLEQDLAVGEEGIAITFGKAQGLNTSGLTEGATAYVSPTTPGSITTTKPTAGDHFIQNIGIVMRANASNGAIKVTGIGRANDIPNAEITTLSGDADYVYVDDGGVWKKITPANLGVGSGGGGSASLSGLTDTNISSPSHNESLVWTSSTGEWINASVAGGGGVTDHGLLTGLSDNDHPQYVLSSTNNDLSTLVTSIETSTVDLSSYIASNETTWSTDNDTTDHTALSNIGTNTHAQIDSHIASGSVHFTEASIDHGSIAGLGDNDHPQYVLSSTNNALSSLVTNVEGSTVSLSSYIAANETTWSTDNDTTDHTALSNIGTNSHTDIDNHISDITKHYTVASIDHGSIAGLSDNDHPQYVLSATNSALSSQVDANTADISNLGSASGNWDSTYGTVNSLSSTWEPETAAEILTKLLTVDGAGSNLDADKLDGEDSYEYIQHNTYVQPFNPFGSVASDKPRKIYASHLTDRFLGRESEIYVAKNGTEVTGGSKANLFDGAWDTVAITESAGGSDFTVSVDMSAYGLTNSNGFTYSNGFLILGFYSGKSASGTPTGVYYDRNNTSGTLSFTKESTQGSDALAWRVTGFPGNYLVKFDITIPANGSGGNDIWVATLEYHGNRMGKNEGPLIDVAGGSFYGEINGELQGVKQWYIQQDGDADFNSLSINSSQVIDTGGNWTGNNLDHTTDLNNVGTNTHAQIDSHIADSSLHFTEASIDHGSIGGLADNDHPQYVLSSTNQALSSLVTSVEGSTVSLSAYIAANEAVWSSDADVSTLSGLGDTAISSPTNGQSLNWNGTAWVNTTPTTGVTDHGLLTGLSDNDHPQYVLSATNNALSSLVTSVETSTVSLSSYIAANETTWSTDNDTTDHTALSNIGTNTHAQIDTHIADSTIHFTEASIDHTNITNIGTNTHAQIDTHISNHSTSATTWNGTYQTVFDNSGSWGGGGGTSDHGALTGLADNDHPQYVLSSTNAALSSLVTDTTDASTLFSGNIEVTGTTASHIGTIGTTDAATFGMQSSGNTAIIAPSIILSATSAYQFRKNGSTTFTDTDFPQSCRDWDSTYNTVLNSSGSWGGGGGGGVAAGITVVNTGTDNINSTGGALVPLDVTAGYPAYGSYATDFSYTAGNAYVTINTAGTYEVTFNVGYTTTTTRWNGVLKIYKGTGGASPSAWIGYGAGKMGYVRNSSGHNEASLIVTCLVTCSANDTIGGHVINEATSGTCTLVANETFMTIKRMS